MYQPFIPDVDIAIIGAGPVGIAMALGLAPYCNDPSRILLVDSRSAQDTSLKADARSLAINFGSQLFLESLDAWPAHGYPIETVHISQSHKFGRTRIDAQDFDLKALGYVIAYSHLNERLQRCLEKTGVINNLS
jgi:2-octaprenyl-6-methoxyphenol hydroxylase